MCDLPGSGLEPVSPALTGGFLTTVPPGKSLFDDFLEPCLSSPQHISFQSLLVTPCNDFFGCSHFPCFSTFVASAQGLLYGLLQFSIHTSASCEHENQISMCSSLMEPSSAHLHRIHPDSAGGLRAFTSWLTHFLPSSFTLLKINFSLRVFCWGFLHLCSCAPMFIAALFTIAKTWKQSKCPLTDERIKKMWYKNTMDGASLVAQWLRVCLPVRGTRVQALVWEDPTCRGATGPVSHNCWACASGACAPQQERPWQWDARAPRWRVAPSCRNWRKPSHRNEDPTQPKHK